MAKLKAVLSYPAILLITINSIMGTGIFFLPAVGAQASGPASILAWLILSIISVYIAACFGELTSMFPKAGGIYEFAKNTYGRFTSYLIGWMTVIAGNITIAMLIVGAIQYLAPLASPLFKIAVSLLFVFLFNYIAFKGMKTSSVMLITFAFITLVSILGLTIPSLFKFNISNLSPFFVAAPSTLLLTIFLIAETFFGWETATFLAEETKDGHKVMPKALVVATIVIAIISLVFVISSLGVLNWEVFGNSSTPLTDLALVHYGQTGSNIFTILVYLAIIGSVAGWIVSAPRLLLAMAQDKLFLTHFAKIHPQNFTPHRAILFQTALTTILVIVGAGSYTTMLHLLVPIVLVAYSFVIMSVTILRFKKPELKRHFKVPFGKTGPILITLFLLSLIYMWLTHTPGALHILQIALSFLLLGIPIYLMVELCYNSPTITYVNEKLSYPILVFEHLFFHISYNKQLLKSLGNLKGKKVLEYGSGTGSLTRRLTQKVTSKGHVYAFDPVKHNIKVALSHLHKHSHLHLFHHAHLHHFKIKEKVPKVDALISSGSLSYVQRPQAFLTHLAKKCKKGAKISILEYDNFFHFIPNVEWISDEKKLHTFFSKAGFKVQIQKKRTILWQRIIITGHKL